MDQNVYAYRDILMRIFQRDRVTYVWLKTFLIFHLIKCNNLNMQKIGVSFAHGGTVHHMQLTTFIYTEMICVKHSFFISYYIYNFNSYTRLLLTLKQIIITNWDPRLFLSFLKRQMSKKEFPNLKNCVLLPTYCFFFFAYLSVLNSRLF